MTINYTPLLSLAEPVTGTQSGTWGDDVNQGLTDYLDIAVAGTQTISGSQTAVTLTNTTGSAAASNIAQVGSAGVTGTAQYAVIRCNGNPASLLTITAPASSKTYVVINATSTNQPVKIVGAGPTTGVTVDAGKAAMVAWDGADFALVATTDASKLTGILAIANGGTNTTATPTAGGVPYGTGSAYAFTSAGTSGQVLTSSGSGAPTWSTPAATGVTTISFGTTGLTPSSATSGAVTVGGTLGVANGGTGLSTYNTNGVLYASGSTTLATATKFTYDSTANILTNNKALSVYSWAAGWSQYSSGAFTAASVSTSGSASTFLANNLIETSGTYRLGPANIYGNAILLSNGNFVYIVSSTYSSAQPLVGVNQIISANPLGNIQFNSAAAPGSLTHYGTASISSTVTLSGLTASTSLALDASKNIVSVTNTGSGDNVLANSPTLVTPALGTPSSGNFSTGTFTWPTFNQNTTGNAATATNIAAGAANQIPRQSAAGTTTFIAAPTTASTYLSWDGSAFTWSNVAPSGSTFATDISVNTLTVGKGPNNPTGTTTFGYQAGAAATSTSIQQTAIGYRALASSTTTAGVGLDWEGNTAVGYKALENANVTSIFGYNTAIGAGALKSVTTGGGNTAVGNGAAASITNATSSTAVGAEAAVFATNGGFTAVGYRALYSATTRSGGSVAIGDSALVLAKTNSGNASIYNYRNTAVGSTALNSLDADSTGISGNNNTALGFGTGNTLTSGSNNTLLGFNAEPSSASVSNEITLGDSSVTTLRCQVTSITSLSDKRDKYDIEDLPVGLDLIKALRPRRYKWDKRDWYIDEVEREDGTIDYLPVPQDGSRAQNDWNEGFVAQEAKAALESLGAEWFPLVYESNPEKLEMSSGKLIPVLVKAIQELTARIEALEAK